MFSFLPSKQFKSNQEVDIEFKYDLGLLGESVDKRGSVSRIVVRENSNAQLELSYEHENFKVKVGKSEMTLLDFLKSNFFSNSKNILLDTTNLSFPEIAVLLKAIFNTSQPHRISFLYCEPDKYNMKVWSPADIRGFELTHKLSPVDFIPTFYNASLPGKEKYLLAFLGFEDTRFSRVIDPDFGGEFSAIGAAFSVPPFQTGFETHSLMANSRVLQDNNIDEPFFVAGNQPFDALELISKLIRSCAASNQELVVAPLGTKPTAIAVALVAAMTEDVSVIFDFPEKKNNRSSGVGTIHYYPLVVS